VQIDASLAGGVPSCGFLDIRELVPSHLEQHDIEKLVDCSMSIHSCLQRGAQFVAGSYLVSEEMLAEAKAVARKLGIDTAEKDLISGTRTVPSGKTGSVPSAGEPSTALAFTSQGS
jgi:hypothetical protein